MQMDVKDGFRACLGGSFEIIEANINLGKITMTPTSSLFAPLHVLGVFAFHPNRHASLDALAAKR
jgi:hypothetical protein